MASVSDVVLFPNDLSVHTIILVFIVVNVYFEDPDFFVKFHEFFAILSVPIKSPTFVVYVSLVDLTHSIGNFSL